MKSSSRLQESIMPGAYFGQKKTLGDLCLYKGSEYDNMQKISWIFECVKCDFDIQKAYLSSIYRVCTMECLTYL